MPIKVIIGLFALSSMGLVQIISFWAIELSMDGQYADPLNFFVSAVLPCVILLVLGMLMCVRLYQGNPTAKRIGYIYCGASCIYSLVKMGPLHLIVCAFILLLLHNPEVSAFRQNEEVQAVSWDKAAKTAFWKRTLFTSLPAVLVFGGLTVNAMLEMGDRRIFQVIFPALMLTFTTTLAFSVPKSIFRVLTAFMLNLFFCPTPLLLAVWVSGSAYAMMIIMFALEIIYIGLMIKYRIFTWGKRRAHTVAEKTQDVPQEKCTHEQI